MQQYAKKLMTLREGEPSNEQLPSAIFGTASTVAQSIEYRESIRIGVWPLTSSTDPHLALGIMTILSHLLDGWRDIRVYRLFVNFEDSSQEFAWSIDNSQFEVDDWELEALDENVGLWGTLEQSNNGWELSIELEDDRNEDDAITLSYSAITVAELVNQLASIAMEIGQHLGAPRVVLNSFDESQLPDDTLSELIKSAFDWQLHLLLGLWGNSWPDGGVVAQLDKLLDKAQLGADAFSAWCVGSSVAHAMLPGYKHVADKVSENAERIIDLFPDSAFPSIFIGNALYQLGEIQEAYRLLEEEVDRHKDNVMSWLTLADLYRQSGRFVEMVDTYQRAIEEEAVNAILYRNYGVVLDLIDDEGLITEFILIDPDEHYDKLLTWEAIEAYEESRKLDPDSVALLQRQVMQLMDVADEAEDRLLEAFRELVKRDKKGDLVRTALDNLYVMEDIEAIIEILEVAVEQEDKRPELRVNLAVAYLADEEYELALEELETADELIDNDNELIFDIDRLMLSANDPEFETQFADIEAQVYGGGTISGSDIAFLEHVIESAPTLVDARIMLGRAYINKGALDDALTVMLTGYEENPNDIDTLLLIGQIYWNKSEYEKAFEFLNLGLEIDSNYVPLLATTGLYLFEDGQHEEARTFLARAEAIAPNNRTLRGVQRRIADMMAKGNQ